MTPAQTRAAEARQILEQNRVQLRATVQANPAPERQFPRSATFRWLARRLTPGALASSALTALLFRRPLLRQLLGGVLRRSA